MNAAFSWRSFRRGTAGIVFLMLMWDAFARSGLFTQAITPPLSSISVAAWHMTLDGALPKNALFTLGRVLLGLFLACLVGVPVGMLMGRVRWIDKCCQPLVSALMPIPSLAWVPLFILWFGIGETATIMVVTYAATFPVIYNVQVGVRAVNPVWVRSAVAMGAGPRQLFRHVVLPGALPYVLTGVRLGFGRAWIAVIGGEMLASPTWGLGRVIYDANMFLDSGVMLASVVAIGVIGLIFERVVFQAIETATVTRWGMAAGSRR